MGLIPFLSPISIVLQTEIGSWLLPSQKPSKRSDRLTRRPLPSELLLSKTQRRLTRSSAERSSSELLRTLPNTPPRRSSTLLELDRRRRTATSTSRLSQSSPSSSESEVSTRSLHESRRSCSSSDSDRLETPPSSS